VAGYVKDYMEHRFPLVPGLDASGVVEAIGEGVSGFSNGDEVVGISERPFVGAGTFAQLVALPVLASARKPSTVGYVEAAALPTERSSHGLPIRSGPAAAWSRVPVSST